jgi:GTPase SAR1 family protein
MNEFNIKGVSIFDIASKYGAEPLKEQGEGVGTRVNPLRSERHSSLKLYTSSNTWCDYGDNSTGDAADFVMTVEGIGFKDALDRLKTMSGFVEGVYKPRKIVTRQDYMKPESVKKAFDSMAHFNPKDEMHNTELYVVVPKYAIEYLKNEHDNWNRFFSKIRYHKTLSTLVVGTFKDNKIVGFRYRKKGDIKWCAEKNTDVHFPFVNEHDGDITIIVEGSHDAITADALCINSIGIPNAGYKLDNSYVLGKKCLFIPDNDKSGLEGMQKTIVHCAASDPIVFDHKRFAKDNKIKEQKDLSDYAFLFKSRDEFVLALENHAIGLKSITQNIDDILDSEKDFVTLEYLDNLANTAMLIPDVLQQSAITILVGKPGVGKSAITLSFVNKLFDEKSIDRILYFDADNGPKYTKERLENLIKRHGQSAIRYYHQGVTTKDKMVDKIKMLATMKDGERTIIVIDSLKNFIKGSNTDDKMANELFDSLQLIRDRFGATIIILHHTKKGKNEDGTYEYVGSQVIEASTDNLSYVERKDKLILVTPSSKTRAMLENKAYQIDIPNMNIIEDAYPIKDDEDDTESTKSNKSHAPRISDDEYAESIYSLLCENGATVQANIVSSLKGVVPNAKVSSVLWDDKYKNILWNYEKMNPKGWRFTAIKKTTSIPEVIEYQMDLSVDLF